MFHQILLSVLFSSLLFAEGSLHDPASILKRSDKFLSVPTFEKAFQVGQKALTLNIVAAKEVSRHEEEVFEVSNDEVKYRRTDWLQPSGTTYTTEYSLTKKAYEEIQGNRLRDIVDLMMFWGDKVHVDSAVQTLIKVGNKKIPALEVRMRGMALESPVGFYNVRAVLIRKHYFAQLALLETYIPAPGYEVERQLLSSYQN